MPSYTVSFIRPFSRILRERIDVIIASFGLNFLTLALPLVILIVYDKIIPSETTHTFAFLVLGLIIVVFLDFVLRTLRTYITTWAASRFDHAAGSRIIQHILGSEIQEYEKKPPASYLERYAAIETLRDNQSGEGLISFTELPFAIIFIFLIWIIGGGIVLAPLFAAFIVICFALWMGKRMDTLIRDRNHYDDVRYNFIFQALNAIHSVKGLGIENALSRQYQHILSPLSATIEKLIFVSSLGQSIGAVLSNFAMVSVAILGSVLVIDGDLTGGALMACTLLSGRALQPLTRMIGIWVQIRSTNIASEQLKSLSDLKLEPKGEVELDTKLTGKISLENVTVHRGIKELPILDNVNCEIQPGEIIAIQGKTGGGKSALLEVLAGLIPIDGGSLKIDGIEMSSLSKKELRKHIGYVRQSAPLFKGTLRENLVKFKGREHLTDALEVANQLGLTKIIASMPKGLSTQVGESASEGLPSSVQQMACIVLTFAENPEILLLDEANSALDGEADVLFREYIAQQKGKKTILMITERPSLVAVADRIIEVTDAKLMEVAPQRRSS